VLGAIYFDATRVAKYDCLNGASSFRENSQSLHEARLPGHPEFLFNIVYMDIYFFRPRKAGVQRELASRQNYERASRFPKKKFVAKQFA
jgi:hypothetical protein